MDRAKVRRTTAIAAISTLFNLLLLLGLTVGVPWSTRIRSLEQPDVVVSLLHPPPPAPERAQPNKPVERPRPPNLTPHVLAPTAPPATPPTINLPQNPLPDADAQAAMGNVVKALRGSVGCSHPDAANLTEAEREACRRRFHVGLEDAKPMLSLTAEKRARFDHASRCQDMERRYREAAVPNGRTASNGAFGMPGLGYIPSPKDCKGP